MANVDLKTNFKNGDKLYDYELNNNFKTIQAALGAMNKIVWQNDDNASLVMFAGTTEQITNRELIEGQLLYNTQTGETYIDAMVDTELKRVSTGGGTSIQIGGIEPTNPATKLWVEDDLLDNIGSEIESGSNENGSYIKFADGTMICYGLAIINNPSFNDYYGFFKLTNESVQTLPQEFINNNYKLLVTSNVFGYFSGIVSNKLTSSFQFYGCTHKQTSEYNPGNGYFNYIAIGRWK